jgi:hypothetical protein
MIKASMSLVFGIIATVAPLIATPVAAEALIFYPSG